MTNGELRALWMLVDAHGGKMRIGQSFQNRYPGDNHAHVVTYTDPQSGDFVVEARDTLGEQSPKQEG